MTLILIVAGILLYIFLRDRLKLNSWRVVIFQLVLIVVIFAVFLLNLIYNETYFKNYSGEKTDAFYRATAIYELTIHPLIVLVLVLFFSVLGALRNNMRTK
jgi:hypothetical protein